MDGPETIDTITGVTISELTPDDIPRLQPILEQHIRSMDDNAVIDSEVSGIMHYMRGGTDEEQRRRTYLVAKDEAGRVLGCMAYTEPERDLVNHLHLSPEEAYESVNAYVDASAQRAGIGQKLFTEICRRAKNDGRKKIVFSSGPRYERSWGFHNKISDADCGLLMNKYGKDFHARVWSKTL